MAALDIMETPEARRWLGGIEPAWTLLDKASFEALRRSSAPMRGLIRLSNDLTLGEVQLSAMARNALILLRAAAEAPGLKMTATGNLTRAVVAEMLQVFTWPDYDKEGALQFHRVINEPDFLPLYFVRPLVEAAGFLRRYKGHLRVTPSGRKILSEANALPAILLHMAMWLADLSYLGRGLHNGWPQDDVGIVLWSLSVAANEWESPERLARLCTIPIPALFQIEWDTGAMVMEARVLRPLLWSGLLDHKREKIEGSRFGERHLYRKTALFDRMIKFHVALEPPRGSAH